MAVNWWSYARIEEARANKRAQFDEATNTARQALAAGDVAGAKVALGKAAPSTAIPGSEAWRKKVASAIKPRFEAARVVGDASRAVSSVVPDVAPKKSGNRFLDAVKGAGAVAGVLNPNTMVGTAAGIAARATGLDQTVSDQTERLPQPVRTAASFGTALNEPLPTVINAAAGDQEAQANLNRFTSGERLQRDLGLPTGEYDYLRSKGPVGRFAAVALDQATAPSTYAGGVGIGQGFAKVGTRSVVAKSLAQRWAQEVGAATVGTFVGQETATQVAKHTDNPWLIGGAALAAGGAAGAVAYNPAAAARGAAKLNTAAVTSVKSQIDQAGGVKPFLQAEAGQATIPGGRRDQGKVTVYHGNGGPLDGPLKPDSFVTTDRKAAEVFAKAEARLNGGTPTVHAFEADPAALKDVPEGDFAATYGGAKLVADPAGLKPASEAAGAHPEIPVKPSTSGGRKAPIKQADLDSFNLVPPPPDEPLAYHTPAVTPGMAKRELLGMATALENPAVPKVGRVIQAGPLTFGKLKDFPTWLREVQDNLTPEEIQKSLAWYKQIRSEFAARVGEENAGRFTDAFMSSQVNASPGGGVTNVMRAADKLSGAVRKMVAGSSGHNERSIMNSLNQDPSLFGISRKISDFIDSEMGKTTRTWMGNDPRGGAPFVADVWMGRDAGYVDEVVAKYIKENAGIDIPDSQKDFVYTKKPNGTVEGGTFAPTADQYETVADWGRGITQQLNESGFMGRTWTTEEVQALGWAKIRKMMGAAADEGSVDDMFAQNTRRLSFELNPGEGSPLAQKYDFNALAPEQQKQLTDIVLEKAVDWVKQHVPNVSTTKTVRSWGGWSENGQATLAPSWQVDVFGSPEAALDVAESLGHLTQQSAMVVSKPLKSGKTRAVHINFGGLDANDPQELRRVWETINAKAPDLFGGFSPEADGIMVADLNGVWGKGGWQKNLGRIEKALADTNAELGTDLTFRDLNLDVHYPSHNWADGGVNSEYVQRIGARGRPDLSAALLDPATAAERDSWWEEGWKAVGGPQAEASKPGFLQDAAGQVGVHTAADLGVGAASAAYGYATGDSEQDRWKRALAFGVAGTLGAAAVDRVGRFALASAPETQAPPRPPSVLSQLPPDQVENSYTNASGIQRIIPKPGTARADAAVAAKAEAAKNPSSMFKSLPPVLQNGTALLNPSVTQDQPVLIAWRAGQGVRAQLQTAWTTTMNPVVQRVEAAMAEPGAFSYKGPTGTPADALIGTAKDIAENPELYDISPTLRSALDDLSVAMWDDVAAQARQGYGVEVMPFEGNRKPGFVFLPTMKASDSVDDKLMSAFDSLSTKSGAKRRGFTTAREHLMAHPDDKLETDLRELVSTHVQAMASNAGNKTFRNGAGGKTLPEVIAETHPGLKEAKDNVHNFVTSLNNRMKTATAAKKNILDKMGMTQSQLNQVEKRMKPIEARVMELEAGDEFGTELSYLSGQLRELRMQAGKLKTWSQTLEGRKVWKENQMTALDNAINTASQAYYDDVLKNYQSAKLGDYVRDPLTQKYYTPQAVKTIRQLHKVPEGFGKTLANISDEIRAWHLAGDASLGTIQGGLGVMSDPINAARTARRMFQDGNPVEALQKIAAAEPDDVAQYTFVTNRSFGSPLSEIRMDTRGVNRIKPLKAASDQLEALFQRGSYEAWKRERDLLIAQNPGISSDLAAHEAANVLSKVVPGLNPTERGVSGLRGAVERNVATSVSFATSPFLLGAEAAKGTAELMKQGMYKLARSASANPEGAWAALSPREQVAIRRGTVLASTVMAMSVASAIASAESRNMSVQDAVKETFDPGSRYFAAFQLGNGRSIPLGGPFRSAIKAIAPDSRGVMFGNLPSWFGSRLNSPYKPAVDIARNKDFFGDPIYQGNISRPENALRALWYFGDQALAPVSVGQVSQDVRKGEVGDQTILSAAAQFLGSNYSPVSPTEKLNQISRARFDGKNFFDLLPAQKRAIQLDNPKLWDESVKAGSETRQQAAAMKAKVQAQQEGDDALLLKGGLTTDKWWEGADDRSNQLVGADDALYGSSDSGGKQVSPVLDAYYAKIKESSDANNGRPNWDEVNAWKDKLPKADQQLIAQNTGLNKTPLVKLRSMLTQEYYQLPRYRGYTADQAVAIDALWQEVRNAAPSSDQAYMLAAMRKNPALTQGADPKVVEGVKRRILGLLSETSDRKNWAKAHPESALFLRNGRLTEADVTAIQKALKTVPK